MSRINGKSIWPFNILPFPLSGSYYFCCVDERKRGRRRREERERDEESGYGDLCLCQTSSSIIIFESKVPREESNLKTSACLAFAITHLKIRSGIYLVYLGHCLLIFSLCFGNQICFSLSHSYTPFSFRDKTLRPNLSQISLFPDPRYDSHCQWPNWV